MLTFTQFAKWGLSLLFACLFLVVLGCSNHGELATPPKSVLTMTREQLQHVLTIGMDTNDIARVLGAPRVLLKSEKGEMWDYPLHPFLENSQTTDLYVVAVTMQITNGHLAEYNWALMRTYPSTIRTEELRPNGSVTNMSGLEFFVVTNHSTVGSSYIDTALFPKLGYIAATPDFCVDTLAAVRVDERSSTSEKKWSFVLTLEKKDMDKFSKFTMDNFGNVIYIMAGNKPIAAPKIMSPIKNGIFEISAGNAQMEISKDELRKLVKR